MAVQIQFRRGNTAQHSVFTGAVGEVTVDTDKDILVVHDGSTVGGFPLAPIFTYDLANTAFNQANTGTTIATASFGKANDAYAVAVAAFDTANNSSIGIAAFDYANSVGIISSAAYDKANSANVLAYNTGIGANAYSDVVGTSANNYLLSVISGANVAVGTAANTYADSVGVAANAFASATIAGANVAVGAGANAYADVVGTSANTYLLSVIAGANTAVGTGANTVGSAAFNKANLANIVASAAYDEANTKLSSSGGTISGDLAIVGNLAVSGNTSYINVVDYRVDDPLIYLAGNNYISDIVDIGFIANYVNTTGQNVHTGLVRDYENKEYYLFYGYDQEPVNNHVDPNGNNFTIAVLNADLKTSNLVLGGQNTINWITSAYDQANVATTIGESAFDKANSAAQEAYTSVVANGTNIVANSTNALSLLATQNVSIVGNGTTGEVTFDLTNTGVIASTYGGATAIPVLIVDEKGRITGVSNVAVVIPNPGGGYFAGNRGDITPENFGDIFRVHSNTLTANVTVYSGNNSIAAGPITIGSGGKLTIEDGARVSIV